MRARVGLAVLVLTVPAVASAQRTRVYPPQSSTAPRPAEKPPLAPGIPDSRLYTQYRLWRFSFEQYPMLTGIQSTGMVAPGIPSDYTMFGTGTQLNYRVAPSLALTTDMTSAFSGAPFSLGSLDFGVRVKPWTGYRVRPFADARASLAYTVPASGVSQVIPVVLLTRTMVGDLTTGGGHGAFVGVGAEMNFSRSWLVTTTLSATRYAMTGRNLTSHMDWAYNADAYRLGVGVRYNPGRWFEAH